MKLRDPFGREPSGKVSAPSASVVAGGPGGLSPELTLFALVVGGLGALEPYASVLKPEPLLRLADASVTPPETASVEDDRPEIARLSFAALGQELSVIAGLPSETAPTPLLVAAITYPDAPMSLPPSPPTSLPVLFQSASMVTADALAARSELGLYAPVASVAPPARVLPQTPIVYMPSAPRPATPMPDVPRGSLIRLTPPSMIELVETGAPARAYVTLGEIRVESPQGASKSGRSRRAILQEGLRARAFALEADAVIDVRYDDAPRLFSQRGDQAVGVAIRYR